MAQWLACALPYQGLVDVLLVKARLAPDPDPVLIVSAFHRLLLAGLQEHFESVSGNLGKLAGPAVDEGMAIDVVDAGHLAVP